MTINASPPDKASPLGSSDVRFSEQIAAFETWLHSLKVPEPQRLILVNPQIVPEQYFDLRTARNGAYHGYPPVGLLYLAAAAKEVRPQLDVKVIDLNYEILRRSQSDDFSYQVWQDLLSEEIQRCDATHVGVTYMFGTSKETFVNACRYIREVFPDVPILAGGVQATYDYKEILEDGLCDFVVRNEGELQLKAFLESCVAQQPVTVPWGSAFRLGGEIYELGESQKDVPMDRDIRPFYSQLDIGDYHKYGALGFSKYLGEELSFATVLSNRGCRARCTFCTVRDFNGFGVKMRSVENVIEEIRFLVRDKGIQCIDFLDDDLLWDPKRTVELLKGLAEQVPELQWTSTNGLIAAAISEEIMHWMVESGIRGFNIGIESGNDKMLHLIKKPTTKAKLRDKRQLFRKYPEVFVIANFMIGFPNETFGEMIDSFNFASELKWDWCRWNICQPLKGTEQFSVFQELGDSRCDVEDYSKTLNPMRSAAKADVGYMFRGGLDGIRTGMDVFNLPYDEIPSSDQLKEIWFTFNLVANFLNNTNFESGGNPAKLIRWMEAIHSGYPYDASMSAALAQGYKLVANEERATFYQKKFESIVVESAYWKRRVEEFPKLLEISGVTSSLLNLNVSGPIDPLAGAILPHVTR